MPSQLTIDQLLRKNSRIHVKNRVNTPVLFHKLVIPSLPKAPSKTPQKTKNVAFSIKPKEVLDDDEIHARKTYINSLEPFWNSGTKRDSICRKFVGRFKSHIYNVELSDELKDESGRKLTMERLADFQGDGDGGIVGITDSTKSIALGICEKMADMYRDAIFNKSIGQLCTLHLANFEEHQPTVQTSIFRQRTREVNRLFLETQGILNQFHEVGFASGVCDGKATISYIVGCEGKYPGVYSFKTAKERNTLLENGAKSSFNRQLPFSVTNTIQYQEYMNKKASTVKKAWAAVGTKVADVVMHRLVQVLPVWDDVPSSTKDWDESKFSPEKLAELDAELERLLTSAMLKTFDLGHSIGIQSGQQSYKEGHLLAHNPWIYTFVDVGSREGVYISTKQPVAFCQKREGEDIVYEAKRQKL